MKWPYLEVTFGHGRPLAAYLYVPRSAGDKSRRVEQAGPGLMVDYTESGKPIGVEITAPGAISLTDLNRVLASLDLPALRDEDVAPLRAA